MNAVYIPKRFKLGGRTWKVKRRCKSDKWYGKCLGHSCVIKLSTANKTPEEEWHTFCHELMHAICFTMGWDRLNYDETKIDAIGNLLSQALATAK